MEGFDTMTMSYLASPLSLGNMQGTEYLSAMSAMELPDQRSNFDSETFVSGDDMTFPQPGMPTFKRFPPGFEDPFPDMMPPFEPAPPEQPPDSSIDHNHKLLSFSTPTYNFTLLDYSLRRTTLSLSAQLNGMFFLAESQWTTSPTEGGPPPVAELTCYRRNLFQITGSITLPRTLRYIMTDQGDRIPILAQELTVSATESVEGNPVKIIAVPWKTPAANANGQPEEKVEKEPPAIPLDTMAGQDMDSDYATFPIAWKRLQFRIATANNGRRKELQQHFVVRLKVVATLSTGAKIPICEAHSGPVIVRGRSPRNFQSRKDLPLSGSAAASRKNTHVSVNRAPTSDPAQPQPPQHSNQPSTQTAVQAPSQAKMPAKSNTSPKMAQTLPFEEVPLPQATTAPQQQSSPTYTDWTQVPAPDSVTVPTPTFTNAAATYPQSSPGLSRMTLANNNNNNNINNKRRASVAVPPPISLSLLDDDFSPPKSADSTKSRSPKGNGTSASATVPQKNPSPDADSAPPAKMQKTSRNFSRPQTSRSASASFPILGTTTANLQPSYQPAAPSLTSSLPNSIDSADLLYEYFPLGLDDWQAPVDAVYRPHVVHHTNTPSESKFLAARSRSKRYFAAEDVC